MESELSSLMSMLPHGRVAVAGLGLLGGSIGMACRRLMPALEVLGYARRPETVEAAVASGTISCGSTDPAEILPHADLTVVCMPIDSSIDFCVDNAGLWKTGAVVTDVGSVKGDVVRRIRPALEANGVQFIGSHPMAGAETSGLEHATPTLYRGAVVFTTPQPDDSASAAALVDAFWCALGAETCPIDLERHDTLVSRTSHVLHLLASAAVNSTLTDELAVLGTAGGFRDFTRIAASSPVMWTDIFKHNTRRVVEALDAVMAEQQMLRDLLAGGQWTQLHDYLDSAKEKRESWHEEWQRLRRSRLG